jgi:hypothetical protein
MTKEQEQKDKEDDPILRVPDLEKELAELQGKNKTLEEQQKNLLQNIQTLYLNNQNLIAAIEGTIESSVVLTGRLASIKAQNKFEFPVSQS